jgi:hypothetical protein
MMAFQLLNRAVDGERARTAGAAAPVVLAVLILQILTQRRLRQHSFIKLLLLTVQQPTHKQELAVCNSCV